MAGKHKFTKNSVLARAMLSRLMLTVCLDFSTKMMQMTISSTTRKADLVAEEVIPLIRFLTKKNTCRLLSSL